jgi:hypothetical protein
MVQYLDWRYDVKARLRRPAPARPALAAVAVMNVIP